MYHTISEFIEDWKFESAGTMKILSAMTDSSLSQRVYNEGRSIGEIAWHIAASLYEMGDRMGLGMGELSEDLPIPDRADEIVSAYKKASEELTANIQKYWTDASLKEEIEMYGEKWTRTFSLVGLVRHELHHRAQLTVLLRQAGLKVPGIYGPAKEEWAQFNMAAPK
jgi:uncharacterized damage-inducible protein DinB